MKNLLNKGKILVTYLSIFSVLAASILSVFVGVDFSVKADIVPVPLWNDTADTTWEGEGTEESPYILSNAEEVYGMVTSGGNGKYYKIADGVTALYFNAVNGMSKAQATAFFTGADTKNSWYTGGTAFSGTFDGNGATLYGLYSSSESYNGFINRVVHGGAATVKNVNFDLCYFANTKASANPWSYASGVVFGMVGATSAASGVTKATANIEKVKVSNCSTTSHNGAAILFGCAINASLNLNRVITINNDYTSDNASGNAANAAALVVGGSGWSCAGGLLSNVIFTETGVVLPVATYVSNFFSQSTSAYIAGTVRDGSEDWFTKVTQDQMKGAAAQTNMPGLTWGAGGFKLGAEGEYPSFAADLPVIKFESGTGSETDPYIIKTTEQLYKMLEDGGNNGSYYKVADGVDVLYFNDVKGKSKVEAKAYFEDSTIEKNVWAPIATTFNGTFDGNNVKLVGLYNYATGSASAAFIPQMLGGTATIKNVQFDKCYFKASGTDWRYGTAAVVVGGSAVGNPTTKINIENVVVTNSYVISTGNTAVFVASMSNGYTLNVNNVIAHGNTIKGGSSVNTGVIHGDVWSTNASQTIKINISNAVIADEEQFAPSSIKVGSGTQTNGTCVVENSYSNLYITKLPNVQNKFDGVTVLGKEQMQGAAAQTNMPNLAWGSGWLVGEDGKYPSLWVDKTPNETPDVPVLPSGKDYVYSGTGSDEWDGTSAIWFAAGDGSANDPYIIENCEQFYVMITMVNADKYYKIADGLKALYFNPVQGMSLEEAKAFLTGGTAKVYNPGAKNGFKGYFDGNGCEFYGLYTTDQNASGLFPHVSESATIKNVIVKNSYFTTSNTSGAGGAGGIIGYSNSNSAVVVSNCAVISTYLGGTGPVAGIFASTLENTTSVIKNCLVADCEITSTYSEKYPNTGYAAICVDGWGQETSRTVTNCIVIGNVHPAGEYPNASNNINTYSNVYTNVECPEKIKNTEVAKNIKTVSRDELLGETVKTTAAEFNWNEDWQTTATYPMPRISTSTPGVPGGIWSGNCADSFAGGNGTQAKPFKIDTAERLVYALKSGFENKFYIITEDIYFNDVSSADWYNNANVKAWLTSNDVDAFASKLDGNNHTVYGLYIDAPANTSSGLIPVLGSTAFVRHLTIADAYIKGAEKSNIGAVAGSVADKSLPSSINAVDVLESVKISGGGNAGGIIGYVGDAAVKIGDVAFKGEMDCNNAASYGAIVGASDGATTVASCFAIGTHLFGNGGKALYDIRSGYTDTKHNSASYKNDNITILSKSDMQGDKAKENMPKLDWTTPIWSVTASYPVVTGTLPEATAGQIWSGEVAAEWAGGAGTEEDPFRIETAEQLAKFAKEYSSGSKKYYALTADIYLNDINSPFWEQGIGLNNWLVRSNVFNGVIDGRGHVVYGLYYNYENDSSNLSRVGFIAQMGDGAVIKNLGFSHTNIIGRDDIRDLYTGGIVGFVAYSIRGTDPAETKTGILTKNGVEKTVPVIENCFVDHNSTIKGSYVGGIVSAPNSPVIVKDCFATCKLISNQPSNAYGAIIGDAWENGSVVINCFASTQDADPFCSGGAFTNNNDSTPKSIIIGSYTFSLSSRFGVNKLKFVSDRLGETGRKIMAKSETNPDGLDFENIWLAVEGGTPVLRVFVNAGHAADEFSDKNFKAPQTTVTLQTDCDVEYPPMTGDMYSPLELPTPVREGYTFGGWYVYSDFQCEYTYGYYPPRDLNLYAKWIQVGIIQDFESYSNSKVYDYDDTNWVYNRPGAKGGYKVDYNHGGSKSMHRLNTPGEADIVINYKDPIVVGQEYSMSFWVATDTVGATNTISLVHNTWPDYLEPTLGVEEMAVVSGLTVGEWTQYRYTFTAKTPWISFRTTGDTSLYIDDIMIVPAGELVENKNDYTYNGTGGTTSTDDTDKDASTTSPSTGDNTAPVVAVVAAIIASAIVLIVSKRNLVEVIEK